MNNNEVNKFSKYKLMNNNSKSRVYVGLVGLHTFGFENNKADGHWKRPTGWLVSANARGWKVFTQELLNWELQMSLKVVYVMLLGSSHPTHDESLKRVDKMMMMMMMSNI